MSIDMWVVPRTTAGLTPAKLIDRMVQLANSVEMRNVFESLELREVEGGKFIPLSPSHDLSEGLYIFRDISSDLMLRKLTEFSPADYFACAEEDPISLGNLLSNMRETGNLYFSLTNYPTPPDRHLEMFVTMAAALALETGGWIVCDNQHFNTKGSVYGPLEFLEATKSMFT